MRNECWIYFLSLKDRINLRICLVAERGSPFSYVKNFDRSSAMLKIFALLKEKIPSENLRSLFISKALS